MIVGYDILVITISYKILLNICKWNIYAISENFAISYAFKKFSKGDTYCQNILLENSGNIFLLCNLKIFILLFRLSPELSSLLNNYTKHF